MITLEIIRVVFNGNNVFLTCLAISFGNMKSLKDVAEVVNVNFKILPQIIFTAMKCFSAALSFSRNVFCELSHNLFNK